jgi:tetratricopeptide (TPR) repeat protein
MKAYSKAIAAYRRLIELNPDDPELYKELGEAYTDKGDSENGIAALKQAIALQPDYFEAYAYLGYAYQVKGDIEKAKRIYKETTEIKVEPRRLDNNWEAYRISMAYNNLGAIYFHEEDYHQAIFFMQKAAEKVQELNLGIKTYHRNMAALYARIGEAQANKGQYAESVSAYKEAIKRFNELQQSGYIKGQIIGGKHLAVIDAFEDFVSQNPEDAEAYYCLACLYSAKGDIGKASKNLDKAVELDSGYQEKAEASTFFDSAETKRATS